MARTKQVNAAPPSGEVIITSVSDDPRAMSKDRQARKPDISALEDALAFHPDGQIVPLFEPGARIVIERRSTVVAGNPWLDTQTYVVQEVEPDTGVLRLWNPHLMQLAMANFVSGSATGSVFKLAPVRGTIGKKKRGRPRKNFSTPAPAPEQPAGEKRGRGRPKGSKNKAKGTTGPKR